MKLGRSEVLTSQNADDGPQRCGPVLISVDCIVAESLDIEAQGEALLRASEIDECGTQHAVEHRVGMVERDSATGESVEQLLLLVERGEEGALPPQDVDVAGEAGRRVLGEDIEIELEVLEFVAVERPCIALRGEDGRARRVEGAQGMHQRRMLLGLGKMVEVVGVRSQIDEVASACRV